MDVVIEGLDDYRLLDSGAGRKLELIAGMTVIRPCVQAVWAPQRPHVWQRATSECVRGSDGSGSWQHAQAPAERSFRWQGFAEQALVMPLRFTAFGHCGVFFEQVAVWRWVQTYLRDQAYRAGRQPLRMLNLFGYTGCCSLAAATMAIPLKVFHVDSAKGVLNWGKGGAAASGIATDVIQWIHDDARANLALGYKRGFRYDLIVLDPPAWGHGRKQDKWLFDRDVGDLVVQAAGLLAPGGRLIMTSHTPGTQHQALVNLLGSALPKADLTSGDLLLPHHEDDRLLPAGVYVVADALHQ